MAYVVVAYIVVAFIVMAYIVVAYIVMADIGMADIFPRPVLWEGRAPFKRTRPRRCRKR